MKTGLIYHPSYLSHDTGNHPENKMRLEAIKRHLASTGLLMELYPIEPRQETLEEVFLVHTREYVEYVRRICQGGGGMLNLDTPVSKDSYQVALLAVGGVLAGIDAIMAGEVSGALALVRPPGHHAPSNRSLGFCIFNNVAVGARYLKERYAMKSILILDWDLHHGNGTQDIFYEEEGVFYLSLHQRDYYPFTGYEEERGEKRGLNWTLNLPLPSGTDRVTYRKAFSFGLQKALEKEPEFILISAGFDAHYQDPIGSLTLVEEDFYWMTQELKKRGGETSKGRILSVLEGGYHYQALSLSVEAHLKGYLE